MGRPTGSTNTKPRVAKKPPVKVMCSCCAGDITGFAAYDDPPEGLLCYICASLISRVRKGELDLNDKKERLKFAPGRFDIVKSYLKLHQENVTESYRGSNYEASSEPGYELDSDQDQGQLQSQLLLF